MHVFIFLSLSITQAFHSFLSFLSFAPKIHGGGLQFLCLSPPWCLTPPLLWWGSTHPPWIGILARTIFAAIVNTPLSYYLWNFGTNDKFSPPPSNPGVENLSTWISDTWSSGTYTVVDDKFGRFWKQSPLTLTKINKNRKKHLEMYFHISKLVFGDQPTTSNHVLEAPGHGLN